MFFVASDHKNNLAMAGFLCQTVIEVELLLLPVII